MKFCLKIICLTLVGALCWPAMSEAGSVGKISGTVRDARGEPLPGANVVVQGTRRGATTDSEGYFLILAIEPGEYQMEATMVGYAPRVNNAVVVRADFTTTIDFQLEETTLQAAEMLVVAERPPVEPDRTTSRYIIDVVDINRVPLARTAEDLIELSPGVSLDGNLRIRGSGVVGSGGQRLNETFVEVDGIKLVNNDGFSTPNFMGVNKSALQEVQVVVGGMDAEYGNAQGGVISLITRESRDKFGGLGEYRLTLPGKKHWGSNVYESAIHEGQADFNDPTFASEIDSRTNQPAHQQTDYTGVWGHFREGSFSGPISEDAGFFLSLTNSRQAPLYPDIDNGEPFNIQFSGNATYRLGNNTKVKVGSVYGYYKGYNFARVFSDGTGGTSAIPEGSARSLQNATEGKNIFVPGGFAGVGEGNETENVLYAVLTHTISSKTFYELRISHQRSAVDTSGIPATTEAIRRSSAGFYLPRDVHSFDYYRRNRWLLKGDLTSQITRGHLVKGGFELTRFSIYQHEEGFPDPQIRQIRLVGKGDPILGMEPFTPLQYALYLQDKMEFEGLVVNAGVRFDAVDPGEAWGYAGEKILWHHYSSLTRWRNVPLEDSPLNTAWSTRLGISHPITARASIRFFTGTFHQFNDMQWFYTRFFRSSVPDKDLNGNGVIDQHEIYNSLAHSLAGKFGSVSTDPVRTTSFEVGVDWNFAGDYIASVTAFYKDQEGQIDGQSAHMEDPAYGSVSTYASGITNKSFLTSRGFEISFKKMFTRMTSFNLSYNLQWVKSFEGGKRAAKWFYVPDATWVNSDKFFSGIEVESNGQEMPIVPDAAARAAFAEKADQIMQKWIDQVGSISTGRIFEPPTEIEPGLWLFSNTSYGIPTLRGGIDRRNYATAQFLFSAPPDFHFSPLAGFRVTMIYRVQSGTPWWYAPPEGGQVRRNAPISTVTDMNFEKEFQFGTSTTATGFLEIRNIWNQKDDMTTGFNSVQYGLTLPSPTDKVYQTHGDTDELTRYNRGLGLPRSIVFGARLKF